MRLVEPIKHTHTLKMDRKMVRMVKNQIAMD